MQMNCTASWSLALVMFARLYTFFMLTERSHTDRSNSAEPKLLNSKESDALCHTLAQQAQVTGGGKTEGRKWKWTKSLWGLQKEELWENIEERVRGEEKKEKLSQVLLEAAEECEYVRWSALCSQGMH